MHMVSKKPLNSAEFGDHEDIKESDDGDDGQRRGANKRRSDSLCQTIGLHCQSYASCIHSTGSGVKNHISSGMARELIAMYRTVYHS